MSSMFVQPLRCCVCIAQEPYERPDYYLGLELTVINGYLICPPHAAFAGPNQAMTAWINNELAHGRVPKGSGPA